MSATQNIQASADRHSNLLREIAELDYAPSALAQSSAYVHDLTQQKEEAENQLANLLKKTEKERKEHLDLQKSVTRKWANKLVGRGDKFVERATKEEREYLESLEREMEGRNRLERLAANLNEAIRTNTELKSAAERRERLQREIVELYETIFSGPTPEFPQEDQFEHTLRTAQESNDRAQTRLNTLAQGLALLRDAGNMMNNCAERMEAARMHSSDDLWGFGGRAADMMESNALGAAHMLATQVELLVFQARRFDPEVGDVPSVRIPQTSFADVYFDNIFTDLETHDKIKAAQKSVLHAQGKLREQIQAAGVRIESQAIQASTTAETLARARRELYEMRQATFASIAERGAPPAFSDAAPPESNSTTTTSSPEPSRPLVPASWGSMNPYAALLAGKSKAGNNQTESD